MPLVPLPSELIDVLVKNPNTGRLELPINATEAQKEVYMEHLENIKRIRNETCIIEE